MIELAELLATRGTPNVGKCLIILDYLGGKASTTEIKSVGIQHGLRAIRDWNLSSLFSKSTNRVARIPEGWLLLPAGSNYIETLGITKISSKEKSVKKANQSPKSVFLGHGRSQSWRELKDFIRDRLGCDYVEFNSSPTAGLSTKERLEEMMKSSSLAFIVMTAEDEMSDGKMIARMNVIHEAGLFQGYLGFRKAIIVLEDGCEEFSNVIGISQIRFPKGKISACFEEVRGVVERELS